MRSFPPADSRLQQAWFSDWNDAIARMHYLDVKHSELSDSLRCLIRIKGALRKPNLNLELIKPDVENLWLETSRSAQEAYHAIAPSENGFEFHFLGIVKSSYVTGQISISKATSS